MIQIVDNSVRLNRNVVFTHSGDLVHIENMDVSFRGCLRDTMVKLLDFEIFDAGTTLRHDLVLHLAGASIDSLAGVLPRLKVCDPDDPQGYRGIVEASPVDARLNCTRLCYCTTGVTPTTWAVVKSLYQER
jgi:hypothetical protein